MLQTCEPQPHRSNAFGAKAPKAGSSSPVLAPADHDRKREVSRKPGEAGRKARGSIERIAGHPGPPQENQDRT
jgi:hypothetical protein